MYIVIDHIKWVDLSFTIPKKQNNNRKHLSWQMNQVIKKSKTKRKGCKTKKKEEVS